jgi:uncharacterized repeat protein (TIGR01451 family)
MLRRVSPALPVAVVVIAGFVASSALRAAVPGANGRIAFVDQGTVVLLDRHQATPRLLTDGFSPTWSPDGRRLAVVRRLPGACAPCYWEIVRIDVATGAEVKVIDGSSFDPAPSWSPDGQRIAYSAIGPSGVDEIYSVNVDGSDIRQVTSRGWLGAFHPAWAPDGREIAFDGLRPDGPGDWRIFVVDADGSNVRQITAGGSLSFDVVPAWSPDGSKLVFASNRGGSFELWTVSADGSNLTKVTSVSGPSSCQTGGSCFLAHLYPAWSPDGTNIVFTTDAPERLMSVNPDGTGLTELLAGIGRPSDPEVQPSVSLTLKAAARSSVRVGQRITWTITVENTGPRPATGVTINAVLPKERVTKLALPAGCRSASPLVCRAGDLAAASSTKLVLSGRTLKTGKLTIRAAVSAQEADSSALDDTATVTTIVKR